MHLSDGREIPVEGVFKIVDRPHSLVFTWGWALAGGSTTVTPHLQAREGRHRTHTHP